MAAVALLFLQFLSCYLWKITANSSPISCFVCESSPQVVTEQCLSALDVTRRYKTQCAKGVTQCYANFISAATVIRGCADENDNEFKNCKTNATICSICNGNLCNNWEANQESDIQCNFCQENPRFLERADSNKSCSAGKGMNRKCPNVAQHGRNILCFIAFDYNSGKQMERGCTSDTSLAKSYGHFLLPCSGDLCNRPQDMQKFSCVTFSGFVSKYSYQKKTTRCDQKQKSSVPGCFTIFRGTTVEMGCNSQLPFEEYLMLSKDDVKTVQFCYDQSNCNGIIANQCKKLTMSSSVVTTEVCKEKDNRCFIKPELLAPNKFIAGCVKHAPIADSDSKMHFCTNNFTMVPFKPCNDPLIYPIENIACHICSGPRCRDALGNLFKRTCPAEATSCYWAEGFNKLIERGCWIEDRTVSKLCNKHREWCHHCSSDNYCNYALAKEHLMPCTLTNNKKPCAEIPTGNFLNGLEESHDTPDIIPLSSDNWMMMPRPKSASDVLEKAPTASNTLPRVFEFSCYQCNSLDFFDQSCDEDVRYLEPKPCAYLYGSRPASCYVLIHRGWGSLERGCGSELDKYTYATCDTDLFAECKLCADPDCNKQDMTKILKDKANITDGMTTTSPHPRTPPTHTTHGPTTRDDRGH